MFEKFVDKMAEYFAQDDTQRVIQTRILDPIANHLQAKFMWLFNLLKSMAIIITIQTLLVVFLVYRTTMT